MDTALEVTVIALAIFGALALLGLIIEDGIPWVRRRLRKPDVEVEEDLGPVGTARAEAAALDEELDWWDMTVEALEARPEFELAVGQGARGRLRSLLSCAVSAAGSRRRAGLRGRA